MSSIINATTTNGLVITPDNSGQIQFQLNGVSVPSPSIAPAFSAYASTSQTLNGGTNTKIMYNIKEFDTNNNYDNLTNYRFQPTVAGYYQCNANYRALISTQNECEIAFFKNANAFKSGADLWTGAYQVGVSSLIYMNGTTDYLEVYVYVQSTITSSGNNNATSYFQAFLARTA